MNGNPRNDFREGTEVIGAVILLVTIGIPLVEIIAWCEKLGRPTTRIGEGARRDDSDHPWTLTLMR